MTKTHETIRTWAESEARAILAQNPVLQGMTLDACTIAVLVVALRRKQEEAIELARKVERLEERAEMAMDEAQHFEDGAPDSDPMAKAFNRIGGYLSGAFDMEFEYRGP